MSHYQVGTYINRFSVVGIIKRIEGAKYYVLFDDDTMACYSYSDIIKFRVL